MVQKILIIEDEPQIARVLQLELEFEGYTTKVAYTGTEGLITYREESWDLVLLDVMLPEMNGFEVLQRIRKKDATPVILLTAKGLVQDKVMGLDLGANDYVTKPFDFEELLARIRAALRVTAVAPVQQDEQLSFADLSLNEQTREVIRAGQAIHLTPREYDLLVHFLKHPQHVQSREQILNAVWGYDYYGDTNVVDVYVRYLRQKIDAVGVPLIHTLRGVGYVMKVANDEA
ncbi:response regulator transcription factor [Bacillus ndiopicus]|uniref:response regulator transcription factor n=1 Tax=Bacillus ndiopicus TaxID=1347368 RepID=UPI00389908A1